jgi:hypothetical protein
VDSKYGSLWGGWCSLVPAGAFKVGLWKNIRKGWEKFSSSTRFLVEDGSRISFWQVKWCRDVALKVAFPVLYGLACAKDASIATNLEILGGSNQWNVSFARVVHDWEVDVFASFFQVLHSASMRKGCVDQLRWVPAKRGLFTVKSFYSSLRLLLSLEEYMVDFGSLKGSLPCLVGDFRQDPHL